MLATGASDSGLEGTTKAGSLPHQMDKVDYTTDQHKRGAADSVYPSICHVRCHTKCEVKQQ